MRAAPLIIALILVPPSAAAFSGGPPWEIPDKGCVACHFDNSVNENSPALAIDGLPVRILRGARYRLTVRLTAPDMERAGFLIIATQPSGAPAGNFTAVDRRSSARGMRARNTKDGSGIAMPGEANWRIDWQAPIQRSQPIIFYVWANAGNDDDSPLGDETHVRTWTRTVRR